ncbi:hypothetical protein [Phaeobacter gallaeciensis]|uniref:hypothetical protein n=1 Tax=Phaeobacter gallaeciensis TaxID=60890 RepID=UPI0003D6BC16|nr:hypothetical protein [Phaeobacter gallaeciensis]AHD12125.1 hypothetical protein Gal_04421 [Phaeobacter gallaeciensis DSM 26640]ATE95309.1 hypothetical protein PhaeoP11_04325 [Phaeobacter gallaeciensis]
MTNALHTTEEMYALAEKFLAPDMILETKLQRDAVRETAKDIGKSKPQIAAMILCGAAARAEQNHNMTHCQNFLKAAAKYAAKCK